MLRLARRRRGLRFPTARPAGGGGPSAPVFSVLPVISGDMVVGESLTSTSGAASDTTGFSYQWLRDGAPIVGATANSHVVVAADMTADLECRVTASGPGGSTDGLSNALSSPLKPALLILAGYTWGRLWSGASGFDVALEQPIGSWASALGDAPWEQPGPTSLRPTRKAGGPRADGLDDVLPNDTLAPILSGAHTALIGFDNTNLSTTGARQLLSGGQISSGNVEFGLNYSRPDAANATRQRMRYGDGSTFTSVALTGLSSLGDGPYNLCVRSAAPGGAFSVHTTDPLTLVGSDTRPGTPQAFDYATLFARRAGMGPTTTIHWSGDVRYVVVVDAVLSDSEVNTIFSALQAAGLA